MTWCIFGNYRNGFWGPYEYVRRTDKMVFVRSPHLTKPMRYSKDDLLAEVPSQKIAHDLYSRLNQSYGQMLDAKKQAEEQHAKRVARLIDMATPDRTATDHQPERPENGG